MIQGTTSQNSKSIGFGEKALLVLKVKLSCSYLLYNSQGIYYLSVNHNEKTKSRSL